MSCLPLYFWDLLWIMESDVLQSLFLAGVFLLTPHCLWPCFAYFYLSWRRLWCFLKLLYFLEASIVSFNCFNWSNLAFTQIFLWHWFAWLGSLPFLIFLKFGWECTENLHLLWKSLFFFHHVRLLPNVKRRIAAFRKKRPLSLPFIRLSQAYLHLLIHTRFSLLLFFFCFRGYKKTGHWDFAQLQSPDILYMHLWWT